VNGTPVHLYIYYRIAEPHAGEGRTVLAGVMDALQKQFGVGGRLLCAQGDATLWMEVYENVVEQVRFEAALNQLLARTRFGAWLAPGSTRRTERFVAPRE
jgi:hypothetical protein